MNSMFLGCTLFSSELKDWDVKKVTNMDDMFVGCTNFESNLSSWKVENVTSMQQMFYNCAKFVSNLGKWSIQNVFTINENGVNGFNNMFFGCTSLRNSNNYPNVPDTPIKCKWLIEDYWDELISQHVLTIGTASYSAGAEAADQLIYKGYWEDNNIIYTFLHQLWGISPPFLQNTNFTTDSNLTNPEFKAYEIVGAFSQQFPVLGPPAYIIIYSTNISYNASNWGESVDNLINNLFLYNSIEVSIEYNGTTYIETIDHYNADASNGKFPINDPNGDLIEKPVIANIIYTFDIHNDFFKIVNGDYGSPYTLKITQTSNCS